MKTPAATQSNVIGENVVHFSRILRAAGFVLGPDRITRAIEVLALVGLRNRDDMHSALSSVLVDRRENQPLFDTAFRFFWDHAGVIDTAIGLNSAYNADRTRQGKSINHAKLPHKIHQLSRAEQNEAQGEGDAVATFSAEERLYDQDFESMTSEEFTLATRLVRDLNLPLNKIPARRRQSAIHGHINFRGTLKRMMRHHDTLSVVYHAKCHKEPPLVVLLDVSGSMDRYTRIFLHFTHALMRRYRRVDTLVFGTRLTNISRCLRGRDVDIALRDASRLAQDWRGGTRIGSSLKEFNRLWARRLLSGNATLLLVTDGLDCEQGDSLLQESARLRRFARQIIWLNPLLRFDGFEPRAAGIRTLMPVVDHFMPVHNVRSLAELGVQLGQSCAQKF